MEIAKHLARGISVPTTNEGEFLIQLTAEEFRQLQYNLWLAHKSSGIDETAHKNATDLWNQMNEYTGDTSKPLSYRAARLEIAKSYK